MKSLIVMVFVFCAYVSLVESALMIKQTLRGGPTEEEEVRFTPRESGIRRFLENITKTKWYRNSYFFISKILKDGHVQSEIPFVPLLKHKLHF